MIYSNSEISIILSHGEIRTIEVEQEEDGGESIGDECDKEVNNTLSEDKLPE